VTAACTGRRIRSRRKKSGRILIPLYRHFVLFGGVGLSLPLTTRKHAILTGRSTQHVVPSRGHPCFVLRRAMSAAGADVVTDCLKLLQPALG